MRKLLLLMIMLCHLGFTRSQEGPRMFRDNIRHDSYLSTNYDLVYDTRSWVFDAGSPVRSTPLVNDHFVYFGSARGIFYSLDKKNGKIKWQFVTGRAIHSSAASFAGNVYFSDNDQTLYCLNQANGKLIWKTSLGVKRPYPWRFDYYYSSPVIDNNKIYIGSDDGNLYVINARDGKIIGKFKTNGLVRSTPAVHNGHILFGDTEGIFYSIDEHGNADWTFKIVGQPLDLDTLGYDRKAMLGAPVIRDNKVIFGARDGFLYGLDINDGHLLWKMDHQISWVISTVAVKDSFVVTGTSDGRFVQAVNLETGRQIWKLRTPLATWASPFINNDKVYEGCYDGQLYCIDLLTGRRISQFATNGMILSSPVINDSLLYIGSDDGNLYALKGRPAMNPSTMNQMVYFDPDQVKLYFRNGADTRIRNYLLGAGFRLIGTDTLPAVLSAPGSASVIVFATDYFPKATIGGGNQSLIRRYLDQGGRIILVGNNPLFFDVDEIARQTIGLANRRIDSVLNLDYGPTDTRAFGGLFPAFATEKGKYFGLPDFWVSNFGIDRNQVDVILGENENGQVSAFVKNYKNGGKLVQIWMHTELPVNMDAIIKLAENKLD